MAEPWHIDAFTLSPVSSGMVLARSVLVRLPAPGDVVVTCSSDTEPGEAHRLASRGSALHELSLSGLLADHAYTCEAVATDPHGAEARASTPLIVEPLPYGLPSITATTGPDQTPWGAWTVFNHWGQRIDHRIVVVDMAGRVRFYASAEPYGVGVEANLPFPRHLLVGGGRGLRPTLLDEAANTVWKADRPPTMTHHHDTSYTSRGEVLAMYSEPNTDGEQTWTGFVIEGLSLETGDVYWSWHSQAAVDSGELPASPGGSDPYHANAMSWVRDDFGEGLIVSLARGSRVVRLDPHTGEIHWQLGAGLGWTLRDRDGRELPGADAWFNFQHDPELTGDVLLLHDNGTYRPGPHVTRALELTLDVEARVATVTWEYTEPDWRSRWWGDVDRLPNGHVLVTAGKDYNNYEVPDARRTWIRELDTATDAVVHELWFEGVSESVYRADRIDGCSLFRHTGACPELLAP